jgi:hypothetical protein
MIERTRQSIEFELTNPNASPGNQDEASQLLHEAQDIAARLVIGAVADAAVGERIATSPNDVLRGASQDVLELIRYRLTIVEEHRGSFEVLLALPPDALMQIVQHLFYAQVADLIDRVAARVLKIFAEGELSEAATKDALELSHGHWNVRVFGRELIAVERTRQEYRSKTAARRRQTQPSRPVSPGKGRKGRPGRRRK